MSSNQIADVLIEIGIRLGVALMPEDKKAKLEAWLIEHGERSRTNAILNLKSRAEDGDVEAGRTLSQVVEELKERSERGDTEARGLLRKVGEP